MHTVEKAVSIYLSETGLLPPDNFEHRLRTPPMTLSASFPMYDFEEVRGAHEILWSSVARRLQTAGVEGVPAALDRSRSVHDLWTDPGLLLSQCCGADLVGRYAGTLTLVATPLYRAPGCDGCLYSSVVLVAEDSPATEVSDLRNAVCVVNSHESHSGANALRALVARLASGALFLADRHQRLPPRQRHCSRARGGRHRGYRLRHVCLSRALPPFPATRDPPALLHGARARNPLRDAGRERSGSNPAVAGRAPGSLRGAGGPRCRRRRVHRRRGYPSAVRLRPDRRVPTPRHRPRLPRVALSVAVSSLRNHPHAREGLTSAR